MQIQETHFVKAFNLREGDKLVGYGKVINVTKDVLTVAITHKHGTMLKSVHAPVEIHTQLSKGA